MRAARGRPQVRVGRHDHRLGGLNQEVGVADDHVTLPKVAVMARVDADELTTARSVSILFVGDGVAGRCGG